MEEIKFKTLEECNAFIAAFQLMGKTPPEWALKQKEMFENGGVVTSDTPIYDTLKATAKFPVTEEKIKCVETTVSKLLEDGPKAEEPGLLLGKIQCGKTDTFENIIGLSFDKGIDIAIVLTKGTNALVNQTLMRLLEDFKPFRYTGIMDGKPIVEIYDIMGDIRGGMIKANVDRSKTIIVCKKETANLKALTKLFEDYSPFLKEKKVLIVDDEADFASRNYQTVKQNPLVDEDGNIIPQGKNNKLAKIAEQIDYFRKVPVYCRYLQVTATPYCLFLQPSGELFLNGNKVLAFKPRFTSLVPVHDAYIGGKQYFELSENEDSMYSYLFHPVSDKCLDILGKEDKRYVNNSIASKNIADLTYAIISYFMATAIRVIQERKHNTIFKSSALMHVEVDKKNHVWQDKLVNRLVKDLGKHIVDGDDSDLRIVTAIDACYEDFSESNRKGREEGLIKVELPSKEEIIDVVRDIFESGDINIQIVNSDEQLPLNDEGELKQKATVNIFIGGSILDRGITIKNMLLFFYGRNPKSFQQDTVLQHARMYGARSKDDMAVTRLFTSNAIYSVLKNMNALDNQLRDWLVKGNYDREDYPTFVGFSKNITPCAAQKIKASNALTLKAQKRILPVGIWPGTKTKIGAIVEKIDELITTSPYYEKQDNDGFFEIDKQLVVQIIHLIEKTYIYEEEKENLLQKNDLKELLCALEYATSRSEDKLWALHRTNRNVSRIRENGYWVDAPDDGRTDTAPARLKAIDRPVIMFFRENGSKTKDGEKWMNSLGDYIGWSGTPFYWPLLMMQANIGPVMYAIEPERKKWSTVWPLEEFLEGIKQDEVLRLRVSEHLEETYGPVGTEYNEENSKTITRYINEMTAKKYIKSDIFAGGELIEKADSNTKYGVYSFNNGVFPFELRPYKYLLLEKTDSQGTSFMLVELTDPSEWTTIPVQDFNEDGDLLSDKKEILIHGRDIIVDKNLDETEEQETEVCQWAVIYKLKKVIKFRKGTYNWDAALDNNDNQE